MRGVSRSPRNPAASSTPEHRGGRHEEARGPGGDVHLAPVEQQLVRAHPGRAAQEDRRGIAPLRPADAQERRDERQRRRGHPEPCERESGDAEALHADPDRRERGRPDDHGHGQRRRSTGRHVPVHIGSEPRKVQKINFRFLL
jgi:hypothetical protein